MKKTKILIIVLIALIILGGATFATLYFATDTFKSEQEMFYKYIKQVDLSTFTNLETSEKYLERIANEKSTNSGNLSVGVVIEDEEVIAEEYVYDIKNDPINKMSSATINVNQEGQEGLTLNYLRNQDLYGIMIPDVLTQYIIFENNNLKEFAQRLEIEDVSEIPDKIEIPIPESITNIDKEQIKQILNRYLDTIIKTIPKENYSKINKQEIIIANSKMKVDGYQLSLTEKDLYNIVSTMLNTLKNDQDIFNLIISTSGAEITFSEYQEEINYLIEDLEASVGTLNTEKEIINIKVYKNGKETVKIYSEISIEDGQKVEISINNLENQIEVLARLIESSEYYSSDINIQVMKNKNIEEQEKTTIRIDMKEDGVELINVTITLGRTGNVNSQKITNTGDISIKIQEQNMFATYNENSNTTENSINVNFSNKTVFDPNIQIEEYGDENLAIINYFGREPIEYLATSIAEGAGQKIDLEKNLFIGPIYSALSTDLFTSAQDASNRVQNEMDEEMELSNGMVNMGGTEEIQFDTIGM